MKECKCRFLDEYGNYKKRLLTERSREDLYGASKEYAVSAVEAISNIVRNAHRGMITLDEAMRAISEV